MKPSVHFAIGLLLSCASAAVDADTLFAATAVRHVAPTEVLGRLFVVDPAKASSRLVGTIRIKGMRSVGIGGLAVHPKSRVLYGVTAGLAADLPPSLVTINPQTAEAILIGPLGAKLSDINFNGDGVLFGWVSESDQLCMVDIASGAIARIGDPGGANTGGALAVDMSGRAFLVSTTTAGASLDTVDLKTGKRTTGPRLSGAAPRSAVRAMSYSREGELLAVSADLSSPARAALVAIDVSSGTLKTIGELPLDTAALAFAPDAAAGTASESFITRHGVLIAVVIAGVVLAVLALRWLLNLFVPD